MADVVFDPVTTNLTGLLMIPLLINLAEQKWHNCNKLVAHTAEIFVN